tara:strand:+ start:7539 stop:8639 length:1101 start_codon:yes stop_codon:yes gene_type:complete
MEAGAIQRYSNSLKSYADNIGGIRSALNEGVTLRQNNRLNAIANTQRQKLQNIFLSNIVNDEKLREIHESLSNLSIQAGAVPEAISKLNQAGAFNPIKRAGSALYSKIRTAGTSARLPGTAEPGDNVAPRGYNPETLTKENVYAPQDSEAGVQMENFNPMNQAPKASKLKTTLTKAKEPPTPSGEEGGSGQAGRVGQDFDADVEDRFGSLDANIRPASSAGAGSSTDPLPTSATAAETTDTAAEAGDAAATAAETAGAEAAGETAGDTIASAAGTALAGAAEATGLGAALGTAAAIAGPASILAGLGFGIYELVQAFKPHPHPDMKKVAIPSQVKQTMNVIPTHRTLSVAPGANSAILQAGQSSAV